MKKSRRINLMEIYNASRYKKATHKLAKAGWTIPQNMTYIKFFTISQASLAEVSAYMEQYYTWNNYEKFEDLLQQISSSKIRTDLKDVVKECGFAFKQGYYAVCAVALTPAIEGLLSKYSKNNTLTKMPDVCRDQVVNFPADGYVIDKYVWISIKEFCKRFYKYQTFNASEPSKINRNWLLHGRADYSKINEIDCLRLFNTVGSICVIANHEKP